MKKFVESYPEFREMSGSVSKHVNVVGELSRLVDARNLLDLSACEQDIACQSDHKAAVSQIDALLKNASVTNKDKVRLIMLYALRYGGQSSNQVDKFLSRLEGLGIDREMLAWIPAILKYAGPNSPGRTSDLFGSKGAAGLLKKMTGGLKGVENIYIQHTPMIAKILDQVKAGKLKDGAYPYIDGQSGLVPQEVIVFVIGGVTYAESRAVARFNKENSDSMRVLLGGSTVHNFDSFIGEVMESRKR
jgi:vacuolar protein sorting-associated protein 45